MLWFKGLPQFKQVDLHPIWKCAFFRIDTIFLAASIEFAKDIITPDGGIMISIIIGSILLGSE